MSKDRYKWLVVAIMSAVLMVQAADTYVVSAVTPELIMEFHVSDAVLGILFTGALIIGAVLYPVWGYFYDKYSRKFLTSLLAFILGATTWINAMSKTFGQFFITRLITGIGYPTPSGAYTLTADYFPPKSRGKAMGFINAASPIGYILGIFIALSLLGAGLNWRYSFYVTATISLIIGAMIYFLVKEVPRGASEPELEGKLTSDIYKVKLSDLQKILKNKTLLLLFMQSFFGTFPWTIISFWIITYMAMDMKLPDSTIMIVMLVFIISMVFGNILSGYLSDFLFKRIISGRAILGAVVVFLSAILIYLMMYSPTFEGFFIFGIITAFEIPMAGPSVNAIVMDVTEPELRGSATAYLNFFSSIGSSFGPGLAGIVATVVSLQFAITFISSITWIICGIIFTILIFIIPKDITNFRERMRIRGEQLDLAKKE